MIHIKLDPDPAKSQITDDQGNLLPVSLVNVSQAARETTTAYFKIEMIHIIAAVELGDCNGEFDDRTIAALKRLPSKVLYQLNEDLLVLANAKYFSEREETGEI